MRHSIVKCESLISYEIKEQGIKNEEVVIGKYYYISEGTQVTHAKVTARDGVGFKLNDLEGTYIGWFKADELFPREDEAKYHLALTHRFVKEDE